MRISVVIPVYNDAPMLRQALGDLRAGSRQPDEIIVVDNACTDSSVAIAREAGAHIVFQPIRGIPPAAFSGYDAASGDVIARLDADSRPTVDWLARIEQVFSESPELGVVSGSGYFYGNNAVKNWCGEHLYVAAYFHIVGPVIGYAPVFGSNFAMRREVWERVRGEVHRYRSDIHDDIDLTMHLPRDVVTLYDRGLRVGLSARPFDTWAKFWLRVTMALRTLALHRSRLAPWRRR